MEPVKQDIGVWIDVTKELPQDNFIGTVKTNYHRTQQVRFAYKEWDKSNFMFIDEEVVYWQKQMKQVYVLTEEQLNEIENKAYKDGQESVSVTDFNRDEHG